MTAGWVAAGVRGRGLLRRRLGDDGAARLAGLPSLEAALDELCATPYARGIRPGMDLREVQHAVSTTVLWHLRVLAGWGPPLSAAPLRAFAGAFEMANVTAHLARLSGLKAPEPYELGSLGTAWPVVSKSHTPSEVREALGRSWWGDPGSDDPPAVRLALQVAWSRLLFDAVPGAGDLAIESAALQLARIVVAGATDSLGDGAVRDLCHVLGRGWRKADSLEGLRRALPAPAARTLKDVNVPEDLWLAEARWWSVLGTTGSSLARNPRYDVSTSVGVAALLLADSWTARASLALAADGGGQLTEVVRGLA